MTKPKKADQPTKIVDVDVNLIKVHPDNPRYIKDEKFTLLCQSLRDFPDMLYKRPLIINDEDEVLGGNMRLRAAIEIGLKTVPVIFVDWDREKQREFIIKDNASFGQWDFDQLANDWNDVDLNAFGLDVWKTDTDLGDFFNDEDQSLKKKEDLTIVFEFETLEKKQEALNAIEKLDGSREDILLNLLIKTVTS